MEFTTPEKNTLLEEKGVGPTVIKRFEEIGIGSLRELQTYQVEDIADMVATMLNSSCWKNSPQAKSAIKAAIARAKKECECLEHP